jgi:hypothetical protein
LIAALHDEALAKSGARRVPDYDGFSPRHSRTVSVMATKLAGSV